MKSLGRQRGGGNFNLKGKIYWRRDRAVYGTALERQSVANAAP